jgi:transcriptional regulator with XRE-family HTH domain
MAPRNTPASPRLSPPARTALQALAAQLKAARLEQRMAQAALAERLGVSRYTVIAFERGDAAVSIGTVLEAAAILGVPLMAESPRDLAVGQAHVQSLLRLLPARGRTTPVKVDDDF